MVAHVNPPKVLVIDDEALFREMLSVVLGGEYEVLGADSTETGLRVFEKEHPDAILLDLVMPGRSGIQGLRAIRAVDPTVAVIIVTGHARLDTAEQAMSLGANYYVEKPIDPDYLRKTVRRCVERTQTEKRRAHAVEEMTGMIRQLSTDLQQKKKQAAEGEAAMELMYDLTRPLTNALEQMKGLGGSLGAEGSTPQKKLSLIMNALSLVERDVQRCRELSDMCQEFQRDDGSLDRILSAKELVNGVLAEVTPWAEAAGVKLDFRVMARTGRVKGNRLQLQRALKNLFGGAIYASSHDGGVVRGACLEDKASLEIRIEDHGGGHDIDQIRRNLGSWFGRRDVAKGAGLGFCLTSRVIEKHGGYLHVRTAPGKGTVVFVKLPLVT